MFRCLHVGIAELRCLFTPVKSYDGLHVKLSQPPQRFVPTCAVRSFLF